VSTSASGWQKIGKTLPSYTVKPARYVVYSILFQKYSVVVINSKSKGHKFYRCMQEFVLGALLRPEGPKFDAEGREPGKGFGGVGCEPPP